MPIPLPNLDDRRWTDLVEEGRALIPVYDKTWSDHNIHDPGIMLVELLAWLAEMDIYWVNRIPEGRLRKFLALAGYAPAPPRPARAVLQVLLRDGAAALPVPAGMVFEGHNSLKQAVHFRSLNSLTLMPGKLAAVLRHEGQRWFDLSLRHERGEAFAPFGEDPQPGATFYLGFTRPLPVDEPVSLYFTLAGECAGDEARRRLTAWQARWSRRCQAPDGLLHCSREAAELPGAHADVTEATQAEAAQLLQHHSARLRWEYPDSAGRWRPLDPQAGQVWDGTRAFSLSGRVVVRVPGGMSDPPIGQPQKKLFYLRCSLERGAFDTPPRVINVAFNSILVEQAADLGVQTWMIAAQAQIEGPEPQRGKPAGFRAQFNSSSWIQRLTFDPDGPPQFRLLSYRPPQAGQPGQLSIQAEVQKPGDGRPFQTRSLAFAPVRAESLRLYTWENSHWVAWQAVADLDAAGRADARFVLDATAGELRFGDGEHGRTLPPCALPLVSYQATQAEGGNLPAGAIQRLVDSPHNRALAGSLLPFNDRIASIGNPLPAAGGAPTETVDDASARLLVELARPQRAVTLEDIQTLALETPGVCLARVAAIPNMHSAYPCMQAPGVVTLIVLPYLPAGRPQPSLGLIRAVQAYLAGRRVVGTRLVVVGPQYISLSVRARVQACVRVDLPALHDRIIVALDRFFHPLYGGPESDGWPFGRDVYRSEVLQVIDETPGVEHVLSLELVGPSGEPQCGNVCLGPLGLVAPSEHQIEVL
jgi:hypothetical protein